MTYTGKAATSWSAFVAPQLYSATGGNSGTVNNNPLSGVAGSVYLGTFAASSGGFPVSIYYNFMRARYYPPAGVMPTYPALGSVTPSSGANVYVRNVGTISSTLVSVFVVDQTTGTLEGQFPLSPSIVVNVGTYVDIPYTILSFTLTHGQTYSFTVTSSLGNSVKFNAEET